MKPTTPFAHVLPVPEDMFREPVYITATGWERVKPGEVSTVANPTVYEHRWNVGRVLPEFCLAWVDSGAGFLETREGRQELPSGSAFLYQPGEWHRHRSLEGMGWTLFWIHFNGDLPHRWMESGAFGLDGNRPRLAVTQLFREQFLRLILSVDAAPLENSTVLTCQAMGLLSHLVSAVPDRRRSQHYADDELVNRAASFIWTHGHSAVGVPEVVAHVGCGRRALERRFAAVLGRSILDEIQLCRMGRAKRLLAETDLPVNQVVYRAGLVSYRQLHLLCRAQLGMPPLAYRESATKGRKAEGS
jgi:AraC-like DNA-binding protein